MPADIQPYTEKNIIEEVQKLQYLYGLKRVIRYAETRDETDSTESVAEHIYGMHVLAQYFLALEDPEGEWRPAKIFRLITVHDLDEIETGDTIGYRKTPEQNAAEAAAMLQVTDRAPEPLKQTLTDLIHEYEKRETKEALFVRAIDKFEPLVHLLNPAGKEKLLRERCTIEHSRSIKDEHVKHFKSIKHFTETLLSHMQNEGYFYTDTP